MLVFGYVDWFVYDFVVVLDVVVWYVGVDVEIGVECGDVGVVDIGYVDDWVWFGIELVELVKGIGEFCWEDCQIILDEVGCDVGGGGYQVFVVGELGCVVWECVGCFSLLCCY